MCVWVVLVTTTYVTGSCWLPKRIYRLQIVFCFCTAHSFMLLYEFSRTWLSFPLLSCVFFAVVVVALFVSCCCCCCCWPFFRIRAEIAGGIGMRWHVPEVCLLCATEFCAPAMMSCGIFLGSWAARGDGRASRLCSPDR